MIQASHTIILMGHDSSCWKFVLLLLEVGSVCHLELRLCCIKVLEVICVYGARPDRMW